MFKSIQESIQKKKLLDKAPTDPNLLPIRPSRFILENDRLQSVVNQFQDLLNLSTENYQNLCDVFIHRFAEYVQDLPETRGGFYAFKGGIVEHVLTRASIGLSLLRSYFLPTGSPTQTLTQPQTLWAYTLFTAAILQGIGKVAVDFQINLYDRNKSLIKSWLPLEGNMVGQGAYYKYDFEEGMPEEYRHRMTLLIARQLMPPKGFNWIASNKDIFAIWLSLLEDDVEGGRNLSPVLWRADALAIHHYFDKLPLQRDPSSYLEPNRAAIGLGTFSPQDNKENPRIGNDFLKWLQEKCQQNAFSFTEGPVTTKEGNIYINNEAFILFVKENPQFKNWQAVQTAFAGMGLFVYGETNVLFQQFIERHSADKTFGLRLKNPHLILSEKQINQLQLPGATEGSERFIAPNGQLTAQEPTQFQTPKPTLITK